MKIQDAANDDNPITKKVFDDKQAKCLLLLQQR